MNLGERIKERRILLKITQSELADIAGVSVRTVISLENNTGNPSLEVLSQVADVLGLEVVLQIKKSTE